MFRMSGQLWYGDCLTVMRDHMKLGSVDLIYLDPPFNSQREYNAIYKDETGRPLPDQIEAFCDLWELDEERERALRAMPVLMRESGIADDAVEFWRLWMNALRNTQPRLLAYLSYMVERLLVMKGLLKPTGLGLPALRPYRLALHQGHDGRDIRARKFPKRNRLEKDLYPQ